jgi:DNA-binding MarR family transcriptional regulator
MMPSRRLSDEIKQTKPFASLAEEAFLNLQRTAEALARVGTETLKAYGITGTQYNVLRILRGAEPNGLPCTEIGERMVTRDPDVTRLLDRLDRQGLVTRERSAEDRRVVTTRITSKGLELLASLDEPMSAMHQRQLAHMSDGELESLIDALQTARANVD